MKYHVKMDFVSHVDTYVSAPSEEAAVNSLLEDTYLKEEIFKNARTVDSPVVESEPLSIFNAFPEDFIGALCIMDGKLIKIETLDQAKDVYRNIMSTPYQICVMEGYCKKSFCDMFGFTEGRAELTGNIYSWRDLENYAICFADAYVLKE